MRGLSVHLNMQKIFQFPLQLDIFPYINRGQSLRALQLQQFKAVYSHVSQQV